MNDSRGPVTQYWWGKSGRPEGGGMGGGALQAVEHKKGKSDKNSATIGVEAYMDTELGY